MTNLLTNQKILKIVGVSKLIYLCLFTLYLVTREITALNYFIDNYFVTGFFMGMSVLYIGYDLLTKRFCLKTRYFPAALIFLGITIASCIMNSEYGIFSNIKGLAAFTIYFFLLYPEAFSDKKATIFKGCMNTAFFSMGIYSIVSIGMYIFNMYYHTMEYKDQGFVSHSSRLWGIYQDPNYLAFYSLLVIFAAVYLFTKTKSILIKVLYILFSIIHLTTVAMTGSRTGIVCFIAALFWISAITCVKILKQKLFVRILIFLLTAVLSVALPFATIKALNSGMPYVKKAVLHSITATDFENIHKLYDSFYEFCHIQMYSKAKYDINDFPFDNTDNTINRVPDESDPSNGRIDRWIDGLKLLAEKPFFGISPRNIFSFADKSDTDTLMGKEDYNIHNTYLEILAGAGIIGGLFVMIFLVMAAFFVLKSVFKKTPDLKTIICTAQIVMIALSAVLLPDIIFFQLTFAGLVFWLALGYCLNTDEENYKNSLTYKLLSKCSKRKSEI